MEAGKTQILKIIKKTETGYYLSDSEGENVFIANIFAENNWQEGDDVEVFIYQENDELKATTEKPYAEVEEFAVMECVQSMPSGAFLDWGIIKDLFVPYKEQKGKMIEGKKYIVYVYQDENTGLVTGTAKFKRNPSYENLPLKEGEKVSLILMNETELGWNVVINQKYIGLVYKTDIYKKIYPLSTEIGYIKTIREDGKIDVVMQPFGFENIDEYKQKILDKLKDNYGLLYLSDKSSPEEIKQELEMSKKNFKKAIGSLYKDKLIEIQEDKLILIISHDVEFLESVCDTVINLCDVN